MTEPTKWITRAEAARLMRCHPRTVDYHIRKGHFTKHKDGLGRVRLLRAEVVARITPVVVPAGGDS